MKVAASTIITLAALVLVSTAPSATTARTVRVERLQQPEPGRPSELDRRHQRERTLCAFTSQATNLVPGDTNDRQDAFVIRPQDRAHPTREREQQRRPGQTRPGPVRRLGRHGHERGRPVRPVPIGRLEPRSRRRQRQERRLHPRPRDGKDAAHSAGRRRHLRRSAERERPLRRPRGGRQRCSATTCGAATCYA